MLEALPNVNWLAVLVAALATFFLGGVWYTLLGKVWQAAHGYTDADVTNMKALRPPPVFFGGMIVSYAIMAVAVALLFSWLGVGCVATGLQTGFLLWLGVALPIGVTSWLASSKKFTATAIDLAYQLAFLLMTGAILGAWR